jgi:hypothetical protein
MKKIFILMFGILMTAPSSLYSQTTPPWVEDFDGNVSFTAIPAGSWMANTVYHLPDSSATNPKSYWGLVPNYSGSTAVLETPVYDCSSYAYVILRFSHICKVSPLDIVRVEYRTDAGGGMSPWNSIPVNTYMGTAANFRTRGFSAASYPEWQAGDSTVFPSQSWWKEEVFDLWYEARSAQIQFRFVIEHGQQAGTQASYGWLIDNFQLLAANHKIVTPVVAFTSPFVKDTVYNTGPWTINAKVKDQNNVGLVRPYLKYTATYNGTVVANDSLLMDNVRGDSLWKAIIPQFVAGTKVVYSITGIDSNGNEATAMSGYVIKKFCELSVNCIDEQYSALTHSIDIADTIPSTTTPIVATIKNVGALDIDSATVFYSVNNSVPASKVWRFNSSLSWDMNYQDTLGHYFPKVNGYDSIAVWVKMPNGVIDNVHSDDTSTKIIYGSNDILMSFVDFPDDTVYHTGPFEISASIIRKLSGDPVVPPVNLVVTTTHGGTQTSETLSMNFDSGVGLWKTTIPYRQFGSNVIYAITLTDKYSHTLTETDSFYIKRLEGGPPIGYVIIGTDATTNTRTPMTIVGYGYSFSRQLYFGSELLPSNSTGGIITHLAWDYAGTGTNTWSCNNQTCYFRAVDDNAVSSSAYIDPLTDGATQVWQGSIGASATGWVEIELHEPFFLPPGKNLLVYWNHQQGSYMTGTSHSWKHTNTGVNTMAYGCAVISFSSATTSNLVNNNIRPNARFYVRGHIDQDTSVALVAIESPLTNEIAVGSVPVRVKIRNKGRQNLDSCKIYWTKNGELQNPVTYRGNLPEDFTDTITIGNYIPVLQKYDTIVIWVSMPNGKQDSITGDDTLMLTTFGCAGIVSGIKNIPGDFTSVDIAIGSIANCGISGKVILEIAPNNNIGTLDLSKIKGILTENDTLVIRSSTGKASDVVFTAASGNHAMRINTIRNLYVEHITLNAAVGTHGIEIIGQCDNVNINSCVINANATATAAGGGCGIYYNGNTGSPRMGNIRLINNTINDGFSGIYLYYLNPTAAVQSASTSWVTINGNTIENSCYGICLNYYGRFDSIAFNTINTRVVSAMEVGIYICNYCRVRDGIIGNKINMRGLSTCYGIYPTYLNHGNTGAGGQQALVANNEIRRFSSGGSFLGLTQSVNVVAYIHNSIYAEGTSSNYGLYLMNVNAASTCTVMNNLFICAGTATTNLVIYGGSTSATTATLGVTMDYNNYYSTGTNLATFAATLPLLKAALPQQNSNSVSFIPDFLNTANNLELQSNLGLTVPRIASVTGDITGVSRLSTTVMGAYELLPTKHDLMLEQFTLWNSDVVEGQKIEVSVEIQNPGLPLTTATFGWSVNGVNKTPFSWTANPVFGSLAQQTIPIGSFVATGFDTAEVVVWVETINGQPDEENGNDTISTTAFLVPLAKFVAPFVGDTTNSLSFDVNVKIIRTSGAPVNAPEMYIETLMDGYSSCYTPAYDTVKMVQEGDKWVAKIPKRYYNSTVIYEMNVSDTIGNDVTLIDTAFIMFDGIFSKIPPVADYAYTGDVQTIRLPKGTYKLECWGADGGGTQYYGTGMTMTGGAGGYSAGTITVPQATTVYVYVGGHGLGGMNGALVRGGFNGGGMVLPVTASASGLDLGYSGGGASDIRIGTDSYYARVIVAGGGGGGGRWGGENGGVGGGISGTSGALGTGVSSVNFGVGATQTAPGSVANGGGVGFGQGANILSANGGGGGGGWYGGGRGSASDVAGTNMGAAGGGSGWIYTQDNDSAGYTASSYTGGTWLLNGTHYLTNAVTADGTQIFLSPDGVNEAGHKGHGFVRITTISGGGGGELYAGSDLAVSNLVSAENTADEMCAGFFKPVEIEVSNLGENNYDFTKDSITIGYEIINPQGIIYNGSINIDTGALLSGESMTIKSVSAIPAGSYVIKAYVTSSIDLFRCDDTMSTTFTSSLIGLPVDEDFSNMALFSGRFISTPIIGLQTWEPYTDSTNQILPPSGNGMMRYVGNYGTMAQLSTRQLDLSGVLDPELKFWYYHDATASPSDKSYTDVNIIVDGVRSTVLSLNRVGATTGWQQYTIDLKPFRNGTCVLIQFESMNKYDDNSAQYIGHITITSTPDLAVSEIIISPEPNVCAMTGKELKVVLTTTVNQAIDLSGSGNNLAIQIGSQQPILFPLSRLIAGNTSDTVSVATNVDLTGVTDIMAYLTSPVDKYPTNDTAKILIDIRPELEVKMSSSTGGANCFLIGTPIYQEVVIANTGNVDLPEIELILRITGDNSTETVKETGKIDLAAGDSITYTFASPYTVPEEVRYQVQVTAYLGCDSIKVNAANATEECVDMHNLFIVNVDHPSIDSIGIRGSTDSITVSIKNMDDLNPFNNVSVFAVIETEQGQALFSRFGTIPVIGASSTVQFTFPEKYTVPNDSIYRIRVYINKVDDYPEDDTLTVSRTTRKKADDNINIVAGKTNSFTLGQNIPNPATNSTRIDYSIPEAGQVIFHVHSISGQLLYSKTIEATSGTNTLELNTSTFAAGVYYYSIEYKGQKRVKRMSVTK